MHDSHAIATITDVSRGAETLRFSAFRHRVQLTASPAGQLLPCL